MKTTKRVFGIYAAWEYAREVEALNKQSDKGWQLTKGGLFSNKFKFNNSLKYRYQLDYNTNIEDLGRYIETFREQGWEYVNSTWNGWHYFRKLYDPSLPESEYEIYNDSDSLNEMQGRWGKAALCILGLLCVAAIMMTILLLRSFRLPSLLILIGLLFEIIVIGRGTYCMRKSQKANGKKRNINIMPAFLGILLVTMGLSMVLISLRPSGSSMTSDVYNSIPADKAHAVKWMNFDVAYPDNYTFSFKATLSEPLTVSIVNDMSGQIQSEVRLTPSSDGSVKAKKKLVLSRGTYHILLSDFAGGQLDLTVSID